MCRSLVEDDLYAAAFVGVAESSEGRPIRIVARAGAASGYVDELTLSWSEEVEAGLGPAGRTVRSGRPEFLTDVHTDPRFAPWREKAIRYGIRSSATVPFRRGSQAPGILAVYGRTPDAFGAREVFFFQQLAEELAFAIRLEAERRALDQAQANARTLHREQGFYRALLQQMNDIVVSYDPTGTVTYASPSISTLGYDADAVVGRNIGEFIHHDVKSLALDALSRGVPMPTGRENVRQIVGGHGRAIWVEGKPAQLLDENGVMYGIVTALRDVSEREATEAELRRKSEEAQVALAAKNQFLANISHELRTPLTSIKGFNDLILASADLSESVRRYATRIAASSADLLELVDQLLESSRLQNEGLDVRTGPTDVRALLQDVLARVSAAAAAKGLPVHISIDPEAPSDITMDGARVRQVLLNLLSNAIKFTSAGSVDVGVAVEEGVRLRFQVRDTGSGIPEDQRARIFERFVQADDSDTRRAGGAGLGLAISRGIVTQMGGEIGLESAVGRGSTFWFTVPLTDAEAHLKEGSCD